MKNKVITMLSCLLLVFGLLSTPVQKAEAAIQEITVDADDYNLWVDDIPSFTSEWDAIYANLNNISDATDYILSIFDDTGSTDLLLAGLKKANVTAEVDHVIGMDIMVYQLEEDDEYYPVDGAINTTIICPIPDLWSEQPEYVQLYQLDSSGKARKHSFSLVLVDEIPCIKYTIKDTGVYGFVLQDTKADSTVDLIEPTKVPTKTPTKTPTPKPTQVPTATIEPTKVPDKVETQTEEKPQASTNTDTSSTQRPLDQTPETGDETSMGTWILTACLSGSAIVGILLYLKRH